MLFIICIVLSQILSKSAIEINQKFHACEPNDGINSLSLCKRDNINLSNDCTNHLLKYPLDEFIEYPDNSLKYIYKSNEGNFFNTKCSIVNKINLYRNLDSCFKDVLISFIGKNGITDGFLTKNGVIRKNSIKIECFLKSVTFLIKNLKFVKYKNMIELLNPKKLEIWNEIKETIESDVKTTTDGNYSNIKTTVSASSFSFIIIAVISLIIVKFRKHCCCKNNKKRYK